MTNEEAIKYWKVFHDEIDELEERHGIDLDDQREATILAIKALEKQIPKKAIVKSRFSSVCPSCNNIVYYEEFYLHDYCPSCGQKIDWSEEE